MTSNLTQLRRSGIAILGDIPWGTHFCQFYQTRQDLIDILVPYFKAGLDGNEYCMWITSKPLKIRDAKVSLSKTVTDLDDYIRDNQMEILDYTQWYIRSGKFKPDRVLSELIKKEQRALERGFDGLRLAGNTFWIEKRKWTSFTAHEAQVELGIAQRKIIALCSYSLERCGISEIIDVANNHQFTLVKRKKKWGSFESAKQAQRMLRDSEEKYRRIVEDSPNIIMVVQEGMLKYVNKTATRKLGWTAQTMTSPSFHFLESIVPKQFDTHVRNHLECTLMKSNRPALEIELVAKNGSRIPMSSTAREICYEGRPATALIFNDLSVREQRGTQLRTRMKQLSSYYGIERIIADHGSDIDKVLGDVVNLLPEYARITYNKQEFAKSNFKKSRWKYSKRIVVRGRDSGLVEVYYSGEPSLRHAREFIMEQRRIVDTVSSRISKYIERSLAEEELKRYHSHLKELIRERTQKLSESEQKYRTLFETMAQGVVYQDADGRIISANPASERILGLTLDMMIGRTSRDDRWRAIHEDGSEFPGETHPSMVALRTGGEVKNTVMGIFNPSDETYRWLDVNAIPQFRRGENKPYQVYTTFEDITGLKKSEMNLRQSEERLLHALDAGKLGMWVLHAKTGEFWRSTRYAEIFGYGNTLSKWTYQMFLDHVIPEDRKKVDDAFRESLLGGTEWSFECRIRKSDGTVRWIWGEGKPSFDNQNIVRLVGLVRDDTERKRLEDIKDQFISAVTHELRTPLVSIKGYADYLLTGKMGDLPPKVEAGIKVMKKASDRLLGLTNQLLDYRRLLAGKFELKLEPLDVKELVKNSVEELQPFTMRKDQTVEMKVASEPMSIEGDATRVTQVVMNLLSNASKFTPENGHIVVDVKRKDDVISISVSDNGIGIKPEDLAHVFEPFATIEKTTYAKGSGLGLSVSKALAEAHGGSLSVVSAGLGKGATFIFDIPASRKGNVT